MNEVKNPGENDDKDSANGKAAHRAMRQPRVLQRYTPSGDFSRDDDDDDYAYANQLLVNNTGDDVTEATTGRDVSDERLISALLVYVRTTNERLAAAEARSRALEHSIRRTNSAFERRVRLLDSRLARICHPPGAGPIADRRTSDVDGAKGNPYNEIDGGGDASDDIFVDWSDGDDDKPPKPLYSSVNKPSVKLRLRSAPTGCRRRRDDGSPAIGGGDDEPPPSPQERPLPAVPEWKQGGRTSPPPSTEKDAGPFMRPAADDDNLQVRDAANGSQNARSARTLDHDDDDDDDRHQSSAVSGRARSSEVAQHYQQQQQQHQWQAAYRKLDRKTSMLVNKLKRKIVKTRSKSKLPQLNPCAVMDSDDSDGPPTPTTTTQVVVEPTYEVFDFATTAAATRAPIKSSAASSSASMCSSIDVYSISSSTSSADEDPFHLPATVMNRLSLAPHDAKLGHGRRARPALQRHQYNRVILDDVTRQHEELRRLETGGVAAQWQHSQDQPPPKPSRPRPTSSSSAGRPAAGYPPPTSAGQSTQPGPSSNSLYQPTGPPIPTTTNMYQPNRPPSLPVVPPKVAAPRIMSAEELANHEAQEKLRQRQMEEARLEQVLLQQKQQQAEDDEWLHEKEQHLMTCLQNPDQTSAPTTGADVDDDHFYSSADEVRKRRSTVRSMEVAPPPPSVPPAKPPRNAAKPSADAVAAAIPSVKFEEVKPTPTMKIDRSNDDVYRDTMLVVKAVLSANQDTMHSKPDEIFVHVKNIGKALKELCTSLEKEMTSLPESHHREVDMAQKTTNKDLSQIINQMKLVKRFYNTTQVNDYKKCLMAATQVLAMDAKNLLDVVDKARQAAHQMRHNQHAASTSAAAADIDELPPPPSDLLGFASGEG